MADSLVQIRKHPGKGARRGRRRPRGRQLDDTAAREINTLLGGRSRARDLLIEHLHLVQDRFGHISAAHLQALAEEMRIPQAEAFEVATFYAHFDVLKEGEPPPPPLTVRVCDSLTCEMMGAQALLGGLARGLDAKEVRVVRAPCMGRCDTAPVCEVGHRHVDQASVDAVRAIIGNADHAPVLPDYRRLDAYIEDDGYRLLKRCRDGSLTFEELVATLEAAGLRGLGGAGFPAARKWQFVRRESGPRYFALNADEGEPGTFKDRYYLERDPHRVLEGMLIACTAIEAEAGYIYLRDEYPAVREILQREIQALEDGGHIAPGYLQLRRGAGAYICGEESAMLESIEGKRGLPRHKPPFPAQVGLFDRPTLIHNVETVYWLRDIVDKGAEWFAGQGRRGSKGLRSWSVSGRVKEPGVKQAPAGVTARELLEEFSGGMADGHTFKGYLPGGASGGILPARLADLPLDFGKLDEHGCFVGSHAVVILSDQDSARDAALNLLRFFADESCGQCTPCRVGCEKAALLMQQPRWDEGLLVELARAMADASICGLGQAAANPMKSVLKHFRDDLRIEGAELMSEPIRFTLDGREVEAHDGETLWQVARRVGTDIPHLCYSPEPDYRADGNCRACMVEIEGERVLAASCIRKPAAGMTVNTASERARSARKMVMELLLADQPERATAHHPESKLWRWADRIGIADSRFPARAGAPGPDRSHPAMGVFLDACIHCSLCVRACREVQVNDVIGLAYRGAGASIVFDQHDPMGSSTCVACGECVQACPTGALMPATFVDEQGMGHVEMDRAVASVCPYCGVGCQVTFHVKDEKIAYVSGRDGPANRNRLCVKGRFGFDYISHPDRLTKPLVRKDGVAKPDEPSLDPGDPSAHFREATWDEALERAALGLKRLRDEHGDRALAGFGSAKGSNEEAYLVQKLVRTGFGNNNVDHCTRLCHASSVAALLEGIGSGAVTAPFTAAEEASVIIVIGANPTENHPVAATYFKQAPKRGAKLIVMDPRGQALNKHATHMLQFRSGADVSLLNAMMHVIVTEELYDEAYIAAHTTGFEQLKEHLQKFTPEAMWDVCGIEPERIREVARLYATSPASIIFWGMGISQHVHGTDNARCLISLAMMCGQVGRPGTGLHPLRGQNNVQGASDAGLIPMVFPDYAKTGDDAARQRFEELWGATLDPQPGLTVVEIMDAVHKGEIRGMYIMGENPAMSDPDLTHARDALRKLDHLVVQDLFLTETAMYADVVLPASAWPEKDGTVTNSNRQVQMGRKVFDPPGDVRQDWWITQELANRMGLDWRYTGPADIYAEMEKAMPSLSNISWERLLREDAVTYPCPEPDGPGQAIVFGDGYPTADGRGRFVPADIIPPDEQPNDEYPMILTTGRLLEHWHTGAITRRATVLDELEPEAVASLCAADLRKIGAAAGDPVRVKTRRGTIELMARLDSAIPEGVIFIPFAFVEAAANRLTNPALDPFGKIPEFKFCAAQLERA